MQKKLNNIHDSGYKFLFDSPGFVKQLLENFIPMNWVKSIDYNKLEKVNTSFVRKNYKNKESDVIYKLSYQDKTAYLYLLLEFQSTVDPNMPFRIQGYVNDFYETMIKKEQKDKYPMVFPVVIYNGNEKWKVPDNVFELIEVPSEELIPYVPSLKYFKIIINEFSKQALLKIRNVLSSVFMIENMKEDEYEKEIKIIAKIVSEEIDPEIKKAFTNWFQRLVDDGRIVENKEMMNIENEEINNMFATTIEKMKQKERKKGKNEGKIETAKKMKEEGFDLNTINRITGLSEAELEKLFK